MATTDVETKWRLGRSETAGLIGGQDWSASSLGPIEQWPQSLRTLVDICLAHPLPSAVVCGADKLLLYNDLCARLQGDAHPAALGRPSDAAFPEALSDAGPIHERLMAGEALTFRKRPWVFQRGGVLTTGHYDAFFTPVRNESGAYAYALAVILDAQADSAALPMQTVSEAAAPDALWILDHERMRLDYASPALDRLLGESRTMVQADFRRWFDLVHPDDCAAVERDIARSAAGEALVTRYRIIRPSDARVAWVRHTSFPMQAKDGAPGRVAGLVQDVTAIERTNAALLEEKERYRTLAEGSHLWCGDRPTRDCGPGQGRNGSSSPGRHRSRATDGAGWTRCIPTTGRLRCRPGTRPGRTACWTLSSGCDGRAIRPGGGIIRSPCRGGPSPSRTSPKDEIIEWLGSTTDVEDLKRLEARQAAMIVELERRTESLKGVVRSLGGVVE